MKIVTLGGGTGQKAVLQALKRMSGIEISSIVGMADSGGSSGRLRSEYNILPPGDFKNCLLALSKKETGVLQEVCELRFSKGSLKGHNVGNLLVASLFEKEQCSINKAVDKLHDLLEVQGRVYPVTYDLVDLCVRLQNDEVLYEEAIIDNYRESGKFKIVKAWLNPKAKVNIEAKEAILKADYIIIGPGDLYTSLIQNLLVDGVAKSINTSNAKKIYIAPLMSKYGQTNQLSLRKQVEKIEFYMQSNLDFLFVNTFYGFDTSILEKYEKEKAFVVKYNSDEFQDCKYKIIPKNLVNTEAVIRDKHDAVSNRSMLRHSVEKLINIFKADLGI